MQHVFLPFMTLLIHFKILKTSSKTKTTGTELKKVSLSVVILLTRQSRNSDTLVIVKTSLGNNLPRFCTVFQALKDAGAYVPESFDSLFDLIQ